MIHDLPDVSHEEQEANGLLEALALRLSLTALNSGESPASPPVPDKARPPPRPTHVRPPPPFESPTLRQRVAANRLPLLFPPVGSQWNNGRLARELNPRALNLPPPRLRQFFPLPSEGLFYFPTRRSGYGPILRRPPPRRPDGETDSDPDDRGDATSSASIAPSHSPP